MNRGYRYGKRSNKRIVSTNNLDICRLCDKAMLIANRRKLECPDFGISRGGCDRDSQYDLFMKGRNVWGEIEDLSEVVTYCDGFHNGSKHQFNEQNVGFAIDFFAIDADGHIDYSPAAMALVATCFFEAASDEKIDIDWGGSFKSISDTGHIELVKR